VTNEKSPKRLSKLPAAGSVFVDFLESVILASRAIFRLPEIPRISEIVIGAEQSAREHRIAQALAR
jgi:hypothetical protein